MHEQNETWEGGWQNWWIDQSYPRVLLLIGHLKYLPLNRNQRERRAEPLRMLNHHLLLYSTICNCFCGNDNGDEYKSGFPLHKNVGQRMSGTESNQEVRPRVWGRVSAFVFGVLTAHNFGNWKFSSTEDASLQLPPSFLKEIHRPHPRGKNKSKREHD